MSERITLFFEPLDVLQFRDHRPSDAGYHTLAETRFPLPSVFLGCIRTALFRALGADFDAGEHFGIEEGWARALLGGKREPGGLCPRGPLLACRENAATSETPAGKAVTPFLPPPLDLVEIAPGSRAERACEGTHALQRFAELYDGVVRLRAHGGETHRFEGPVPWTACEAKKRSEPVLLTLDGAKRYVEAAGRGDRTVELAHGVELVTESRFIEREIRVGVALDPDTMTAEDHMLYIQRPFRLAAGCGFAVDVAAGGEARTLVEDLDGVILPLGGKGHHARVHVHAGALLPADLAPDFIDETGHAGGSALWFLTPMPLQSGLVSWPANLRGVTERAVALGGFDMGKRRPKPLMPALPAGTVIHAHEMTPSAALAALGGDIDGIRRQGLGLAVIRSL